MIKTDEVNSSVATKNDDQLNLGEAIPADTPHAVSVSLPTWKSNVGYEEGESWVHEKLTTGYPRFFIHKLITAFAEAIVLKHGHGDEYAMLFPSVVTATRCADFILQKDPTAANSQIQILHFVLDSQQLDTLAVRKISPSVAAVLFPKQFLAVAKQYWQHSGDGISSRRAEFCHEFFQQGLLVESPASGTISNGQPRQCKGPKRYRRTTSMDKTQRSDSSLAPSNTKADPFTVSETRESFQFVEERFGRNLDLSLVDNVKSAVRRRIAGSLNEEVDLTIPLDPVMGESSRGVGALSEDDVYLFPCGMNAIFNAHQMMLKARQPLKSIMFGFPYIDTLKILEKFGPGCIFYGNGSSNDLDDLEARLKGGERFLMLIAEFPGNPLLSSPDLHRIRHLADTYDFAVVIDETVGNFINVKVLPLADIVVSSLTKIFTGECNVMGGSAILNPHRPHHYQALKNAFKDHYEDNIWVEDAVFLERNSRDFVSRIERINHNAEIVCAVLKAHPLVKEVYYPKCVPSRPFYDACRTPNGGYGGLLSVTFPEKAQAVAFFDRIKTAKGPSLGTNFTLTSPYVILAHYLELDWARSYGVDPDLIRISIGLEDAEELSEIFRDALRAVEAVSSGAEVVGNGVAH